MIRNGLVAVREMPVVKRTKKDPRKIARAFLLRRRPEPSVRLLLVLFGLIGVPWRLVVFPIVRNDLYRFFRGPFILVFPLRERASRNNCQHRHYQQISD